MQPRLAYDIGGYNGSDTAHYLQLGFDRVICVEASPERCNWISKRFPKEIADGRVKLLQVGVGNQRGTLPFYLSRDTIWNSFDRDQAARGGLTGTVQVPMVPLAQVLDEHGPADFVKIDVEGVDYACLQSLATSVHRPPYLSCEASKEHGAAMILLLAGMGFTKFNLVRQDAFTAMRLPRTGTLASVKWAARQWLRLKLRDHQWVHGLARKAAKATAPDASGEDQSSGPAPQEYRGEWYSAGEFLWLWQNIVDGGLIDSAWFDIHAAR